MQMDSERLWLRIVVFDLKGRVLIFRNNNFYEFPKGRKAVPWGGSLKKQITQIMKERFKVCGAEVGGVTCLGFRDRELFVKVQLKRPIGLNDNYQWVDKLTNLDSLKLNPATREVLERVFDKK